MAAVGATRPGAQRKAVPRRAHAPKPVGGLSVVTKRPSKPATHRRRSRMMYLLTASIFASALFVVGIGQNLLGTQQMHLDNLQRQLSAATEANANLLLTRAQMSAPTHILQLAEHRLGMVTPSAVTYLKPVPPGQTVAQQGKEPDLAN